MSVAQQFEDDVRRRIYEYVEENGAVDPETVRRNVPVESRTASKPTRSGEDLEPAARLSPEAFDHHVSVLERDGFLTERDGTLRIAFQADGDHETVDADGVEALIRPARQEDIAGIVGVIESVATGGSYVVAERLADRIDRDEVLLRHNEDEQRVFFVATVDDETIGWLHLEAGRFPMVAHTAEMTVGVMERYRGQGIGSALVERGRSWAGDQGFRKLYQTVPETNEGAVSFLGDHGWEVEARREGHYLVDDELVDEVQLATWLD
jgi:GNAT superfamily N-acetyltransferase